MAIAAEVACVYRGSVACDGGWPWLVSNIYVIHYVVLTRIAMVAEVAWFTGGWGL